MAEATVSDEQLRLCGARIERLLEEKKGIQDDVRDVYLEAKSQGYDPKIMRQIVKLRSMPVQSTTSTRRPRSAVRSSCNPVSRLIQ